MQKVELLSPAGNIECLYAAVNNGADAVYLAGKNFGARAYADNFDENNILKAIDYCHLYGVKIYITVNTLIKENEIPKFLEYIRFLHKSNVDAVIMQDIGMIYLVHQKFPNLEIHASTQCHTTNDASLKFLQDIGCKRVVLARELSLCEINNLQTNVEKEVFIHGALCSSYSGQCLFSSMILKRSGNRGECAGMCRLTYDAFTENMEKINTNGKYLFSTKELCTINNLKEILKSNIQSLKIEGRMKSPLYVGYVTSIYRKYIDAYYNNEKINVTDEEIKNLKILYNREFTLGHIFNDNIYNQKTPNHIGYQIGTVSELKHRIKIHLTDDIKQGDAIRFKESNLGMYLNFIYNEKEQLINSAKKGETILVDNKINLKIKDDVYVTYDKSLENILKTNKKIPISYQVKAEIGKKLEVRIIDDLNNDIVILKNVVEKSKNNPITKEAIKEKLAKINSTPFKLGQIEIKLDNNAFIPISEINNIRRELIDKLIQKRIMKLNNYMEKDYNKTQSYPKTNIKEISIITNEHQYQLTDKTKVYYTENYDLYQKYKQNNNIYYILPRVKNDNKKYQSEHLVVNNTSDLYENYKNNSIHTGLYMNVYNTYTIDLLKKYNVSIIAVSPELTEADMKSFNKTCNVSFYTSGTLDLMILKQNIFKAYDKAIIKDRNNHLYEYLKKEKYYILKNKEKIDRQNIMNNLIRMKEE